MNDQDLIKLVEEFSESLELKEKTSLRAIEIANRTIEAYLNSGNKPKGIAAAVLYIAGILEDGVCLLISLFLLLDFIWRNTMIASGLP